MNIEDILFSHRLLEMRSNSSAKCQQFFSDLSRAATSLSNRSLRRAGAPRSEEDVRQAAPASLDDSISDSEQLRFQIPATADFKYPIISNLERRRQVIPEQTPEGGKACCLKKRKGKARPEGTRRCSRLEVGNNALKITPTCRQGVTG